MLKLYTSLEIETMPEKTTDALCPLLKYPSFFDFVDDIRKSDYAVLPVQYQVLDYFTQQQYEAYEISPNLLAYFRQKCTEIIDLAKKYNKPVIVFFYRDELDEIPIENAVVFRTSLYKSRQKPNEFAMPAWNHKQSVLYDTMKGTTNDYSVVPQVGFRGASLPVEFTAIRPKAIDKLNDIFYALGLRFKLNHWGTESYQLRGKALRVMSRNKNINTDFHVVQAGEQGASNHDLFIQNIAQNDYNFCSSGYGNYSYRLYEVLASGRIPVFLNTDSVLPYDFHIKWNDEIVWEDDVYKIDQTLLAFHQKISSKAELSDKQKHLQHLWKEYLSEEGFCKNFHLHFNR